MFQIPHDLLLTWPFLHVKRNFVVLSLAGYWSWVKVRVVFKLQCLQRLARTWESCASNAHPRSRAFSQCTRRKAIYTCHWKPGPYRIKAGPNFYSLINSVPKNYNTNKKENSKHKNSVVMKSQSNNKQGLSITNQNWFRRTRSKIHFCFSVLPNF